MKRSHNYNDYANYEDLTEKHSKPLLRFAARIQTELIESRLQRPLPISIPNGSTECIQSFFLAIELSRSIFRSRLHQTLCPLVA